MRSLQVILVEGGDDAGYSDLQVMSSAAGWYVGTIYQDPGQSLVEPGSRDTGYFPSKEVAEKVLAAMEECDTQYRANVKEVILEDLATDLDEVIWNASEKLDVVGYRLIP